MNRRILTTGCILLQMGLLSASAAAGKTIYVDDDATGANDGSSWANAFVCLQDALSSASSRLPSRMRAHNPPEPIEVEIRVAQGVYRPDRSSAHPDGTGDRNTSFRLLDNVAIRGGFAGVGGTDPNTRDVALYETVLSGDLAADDAPVADPCDLLTEPTRAENSCAVLKAGLCSRSAVLDGFTITSGNAFGTRALAGGGFYMNGDYSTPSCCPSIRNCTFVGNLGHDAGAMQILSAHPELIDCRFIQNAVTAEGGAIAASSGKSSVLTCQFVIRGCTFRDNHAGNTGGAIRIWMDYPVLIESSTFEGNSAKTGGAIYIATVATADIVGCRFLYNMANAAGGGIYFVSPNGLNMTSCTLFGNAAQRGCAIACLEPPYPRGSVPSATITNTILWDGGNEIGISEHVQMNVTYSDVQGGWPGEGNIDADPLFAEPGRWDPNGTPDDPSDDFFVEGDYHLKSQAGRWDPVGESWVLDEVTSPCIDAGDPNSPVGDEPEPNGGRVNMGTYGGTVEASKNSF